MICAPFVHVTPARHLCVAVATESQKAPIFERSVRFSVWALQQLCFTRERNSIKLRSHDGANPTVTHQK
jgi:hypothetical protein